jgi:hypothetical protein
MAPAVIWIPGRAASPLARDDDYGRQVDRSIDEDRRAGDVPRPVGDEEQDQLRDILGGSDSGASACQR